MFDPKIGFFSRRQSLITLTSLSSQDAVGQYQELIHNLAFAQEMHCSLDVLTQSVRNPPARLR